MFLKSINFITIVCACLLAFVLCNWGMDWINVGFGLHPAIAFPMAMLSLLAAYLIHRSSYDPSDPAAV